VVLARATTVAVQQGGALVVAAENAPISEGGALVVAAQQADLNQARVGVLLAREVHGDVTTVLDTRQAAVFGLAAGAAIGVLLMLGQLLGGRRPK
jgi:hypothetical protein